MKVKLIMMGIKVKVGNILRIDFPLKEEGRLRQLRLMLWKVKVT